MRVPAAPALTPKPQRSTSALMSSPVDPSRNASSRTLALRLYRGYLRPETGRVVSSLLCAGLVAGLTNFLAWILSPVINAVSQHPERLLVLLPAIVAAGLARGAFQVLQATLVNRVGHGIVAQIQSQLFGKMLHGDLARLREQHSGAYVSSVLYDAGLVREGLTTGVVNYTQNLLQVLGALVVMATQDPLLTGAVLVAAPVSAAVMRQFSKRTKRAAQGAMTETSALSTAVMESLDGIKIVKIDNREAFEEDRVAAVIARRQAHVIKGANARAIAAPATETLMTLVTAAVIGYAGWRSAGHHMTIGQFTSFLFALGMASQSLRQVANLQTVFAEGLTASGRLFAALDVEPEVGDPAAPSPLIVDQGLVRFEGVSFRYGPDDPALTEVTLSVARGQTAALVGPSGGGKSTILNLIARFYDPQSGIISIDGQDIRTVRLADLRRQIALVTQEPFLFDDTIRANIAYARPDASEADILAAAKAADAHDFILTLPKGYDTTAGEAGTRLSGGQRQRVSIARAFLKNAPILLLDEATSALDTESELKVQAALNRLMAGRTTLMIAHRLSTVRNADKIYVIQGGRVVEEGDHKSLAAQSGLYARLAQAQNLDLTRLRAASSREDREDWALGGAPP